MCALFRKNVLVCTALDCEERKRAAICGGCSEIGEGRCLSRVVYLFADWQNSKNPWAEFAEILYIVLKKAFLCGIV